MPALRLALWRVQSVHGIEVISLKRRPRPNMDEALSRQLDELRSFTFQQLYDKHTEIFGEPPRSRHKRQVQRRIGWRLQVVAHGGLSERARLQALEIAHDADLRVLPPRDCLDGPDAISPD